MSKIKNDPSFIYENTTAPKAAPSTKPPTKFGLYPSVSSKKTRINSNEESDLSDSPKKTPLESILCPLHETNHSVNKCRGFRKLPVEERKQILAKHNLCFRCCGMKKHSKVLQS